MGLLGNGFYFVKLKQDDKKNECWTVAEYDNYFGWLVVGYDYFMNSDYFSEINKNRIKLPNKGDK